MTGPAAAIALDLRADAVALTAALVDIESVSGNEARIADAVEGALRGAAQLAVERDGNVVLARTDLGRSQRVVLAGHLDTVPSADNVPHRCDGELLYGLGACDMKGGVAVMLRLAATLPAPTRDLTFAFYDCEEVEEARNGLKRIADTRPDVLAADLAILLEPTSGNVEGGCQGTLRAEVQVSGRRAHSARSWLGDNAIHAAAPVLSRLAGHQARAVEIDGLTYREGLSAVRVEGGIAGNVVPDFCAVVVNYRFAPDRTPAEAFAYVQDLFEGYRCRLLDAASGAMPGLSRPAAADFLTAVGRPPAPKFGWTDVARFTPLGIPALNFGPGDPNVAHTKDEYTDPRQVLLCEQVLRDYLS